MTLATRSVTASQNTGTGVYTYHWGSDTALDSDDDGTAIGMMPGYDYYAQLKGTLGTGGSLTLQGSFDSGTTYGAMQDQNGDDAVFGAIGVIRKIDTWAPTIRPLATAGDGSTALELVLVAVPRT